MTDERLTINEAASLVRVSPETIRYWIKTKRLPYTKGPGGTPVRQKLLISRTDLLAACPAERVRSMKREHDGNLLTVSAISAILKVDVSTIYILIKRYNLEKLYIDKWAYLIDGEKLWDALHDDPEHVYLTLRK